MTEKRNAAFYCILDKNCKAESVDEWQISKKNEEVDTCAKK